MSQTEEKYMNKEDFISIKKEFYSFKEQLSKNIKKNWYSLSLGECYLIEESCIKELEDNPLDIHKVITGMNPEYFNHVLETLTINQIFM